MAENFRDRAAQAVIQDKIERIKQDGYAGKIEAIKGVKNISEMRFHIGAGYRVYLNVYVQDNEIWLLNGGDKSTQNRDIKVAQKLLEEIQNERK
ncbi:MAG: type II toxin-antitoxin system RelE/ParE family toxin [Campylobacteraceae bacterium]|jgi:putative addiction module killer protein|nr:type II toxin-antitoxin system RelE/ParE family toxin [Campylobacteraceae bacterium]